MTDLAMIRIPERIGVLGLFPSLHSIGGIETSGRVAWQALAGTGVQRRFLLCYGPDGPPHCGTNLEPHPVELACSKLQGIRAAMKRRWPVEIVIIWHLGLIKLLPFLRVANRKVVLFLHGIECWKTHALLVKQLLQRVDLFISNSTYTWNRFIASNPQFKNANHKTVHLGLGDPVTTPLPAPEPAPTALIIGRIPRTEGYKGHSETIRIWPSILERIPSARLWIVGPGELGTELHQQAVSLGIENSVKIFGAVSEEQKLHLLSCARCLALPSRSEGFGLVYLEAMRLGRPCLVSHFDAGMEVVNPPEAGVAADPANSDELSSALKRLLTPGGEWENWSVQSRCRYELNFTASHFKARLIRAIEEFWS